MPRRLILRGLQISFPAVCLVCQQSAGHTYTISRIFSSGRNAQEITISVPLCAEHYEVAARKSRAERWVERLGLILGGAGGVSSAGSLMAYWNASGQGSLWLNLFLAIIIGLGACLILWTLLVFYIAPLFADADSKTVRGALKILRYWPARQEIQLEFASEAAAEMTAAFNAGILVNQE